MNHDARTLKGAIALVLHACRAAAPFFLSIEVWLMVVVAGATVGAFWLAFTGDWRSLLAFGFAAGYLAMRAVLHARRILAWPFM